MAPKVLALVVLPDDATLLAADVGGSQAASYLLESLAGLGDVDVRLVAGETAVIPELAAYQEIAALRLRDHGLEHVDAALLIIDGRVWIPSAGLVGLVRRIDELGRPVRIVGSDPGNSGGRTLCVCLPPGSKQADWIGEPGQSRMPGFASLFDSTFLDSATVLDVFDLPGAGPPLVLDSYSALAEFERGILLDRAEAALSRGVRIRDPRRVFIRGDLSCGSGVEIDIDVIIEGNVELCDGVRVAAHSIVRESRIGSGTRINSFSLVEGALVGTDCRIGPFARLRSGTDLGDRVQIGNYVEIKTSRIGDGSRINHHAFVGDAILAERVTIGAGTITCNHDTVRTNQTVIDRDAYVGSGCNLVAPIRIGEAAVVGAGSTITRDVPAAKLTLARAPQTIVEDWQAPAKG